MISLVKSLQTKMAIHGADVTSYDLLKCVALLLMVYDHLGAFIFPQDETYRLLGRLSAPIWLTLVGYAQTRQITPFYYVGAIVLIIAGLITGGPVFPLNILVTIMVVRWAFDRVISKILANHTNFFEFFVCAVVLALPTSMLFDYGALGVLFVIYGYLLRHPHEGINTPFFTGLFAVVVVFFYTIFEAFVFNFDQQQVVLLGVGLTIMMIVLACFRPETYPKFSKAAPTCITWPLRFMGRYTLEFYVIHLILFKTLAAILHTGRSGWFQPIIFPWG